MNTNTEPELLREWRAERAAKGLRPSVMRQAMRCLISLGLGLVGAAAVVGVIYFGSRLIWEEAPGTYILGKATTNADGFLVIEIWAGYANVSECLAARSILPANERIMLECLAR